MALMEAILEEEYSLLKAVSSVDGLNLLRTKKPDIILLDISLPGIDGEEVIKRIRNDETFKKIPVIAVTAHAMKGDKERFLGLGFDGYFSKPIVNAQALLDLIKNKSSVL